ncbi:MAG: Mth938-like domain-containing protein [candidate division KSB1 bacterium]|nr:Mth938-like domain-containing protein [candidate division KSB1 bacterium]
MVAKTKPRESPAPSPRIVKLSWGRLEVDGTEHAFKDAKVFPGGAREWDWRETGTRHNPGIQPADVQELLEHGAEVIVLSQGMLGALRVPSETRRWLDKFGVEYHIHRTPKAVALYNHLVEDGCRVAGLFHSTC